MISFIIGLIVGAIGMFKYKDYIIDRELKHNNLLTREGKLKLIDKKNKVIVI